jgi:hypothetical protein
LVLAVSDLALIILAAIEESLAHDGMSPQRTNDSSLPPGCSEFPITLKQNGDGDGSIEHGYAALDVLSRLSAQVYIVTSPVGGMSQQRRSVYRVDLQRNYIGLVRFQDTSMYWSCCLVHGRISFMSQAERTTVEMVARVVETQRHVLLTPLAFGWRFQAIRHDDASFLGSFQRGIFPKLRRKRCFLFRAQLWI